MARGEGEQGIRSRFVERVAQLPVVTVAWDYASHTYSHLKETSRVARFTLDNAERSVTFVAGQAGPVVRRFEKQIQVVDDLACKGLGTLEENVPFIMKPTEEIIGDTRKLYESTVNSRIEGIRKYGNDTVRSAAKFGIRQATAIFGTRVVGSVLSTVDGALVFTQNYVDHFLPPTKDELKKNDEKKEGVSTATRIARLSNTVRRRAYNALLLKLEYAYEKSLDLFIVYPLTAIEFSKSHYETAIQFANRLWLAIQQVESSEADSAQQSNMEQRILTLATTISGQVTAILSSVSSYLISELQNNGVVATARDGALWLLGMMKLVPELLPIYIYGLASWLEQRRNKNSLEKPEPKIQNGSVHKEQNGDVDHHRPNNVQGRTYEDSLSDHSIPEEDEDC